MIIIRTDLDDLFFVMGEEQGDYNRIYKHILSTKRDYCFDKRIPLRKKYQIISNELSVREAADFSKGKRVAELEALCSDRCF